MSFGKKWDDIGEKATATVATIDAEPIIREQDELINQNAVGLSAMQLKNLGIEGELIDNVRYDFGTINVKYKGKSAKAVVYNANGIGAVKVADGIRVTAILAETLRINLESKVKLYH